MTPAVTPADIHAAAALLEGSVARTPCRRSVTLSAIIYVLPQIAFRSPLLVVVALICGLIWGALRTRTGGLVAPMPGAVLDVRVAVGATVALLVEHEVPFALDLPSTEGASTGAPDPISFVE